MRSRTQFLKGCTRTLVLTVLSERPMYGYEMANILAERSDGVFELGHGTLYPLLDSLEKKGLICASSEVRDQRTGRRRLYYELTAKGKRTLQEDVETWTSIERGMTLVFSGMPNL